MKRITFAIAAYNHEKFVLESLESVWNDGYPHKEIVIIDDGSSDNTPDIIKRWCIEKNWAEISYHTGPNAGITATLNKLIAASTGDYIRLVSSDDLLVPGGTKKLAAVLDADPGAMAVFGDAILIDGAGGKIGDSTLIANGADKRRLAHPDLLTGEIIQNWSVSGPVVLIRRDFYLKSGSYDETLLVDDWDLYLRIAAIDGLRFVDSSVAKYRIHGLNTSRTIETRKRIANLLSQVRVAQTNVSLFTKPNIRYLLTAERYLLLAKSAYLSNGWIKCGSYLLLYLGHRVRAHLSKTK